MTGRFECKDNWEAPSNTMYRPISGPVLAGIARIVGKDYNSDIPDMNILLRKEVADMPKTVEQLVPDIHALPDLEKLRLLDVILADLDRPDPEIDRIWAEEARKRWAAYREGRIPAMSYREIMDKHRRT
jgi:hypothetical protein